MADFIRNYSLMRPKMSPLAVERLAVEDAEQAFEQRVLEFRVVFRGLIKQRLKVALDGVHGFDQLRVRAEIIRRIPEVRFEMLNVGKVRQGANSRKLCIQEQARE